MKKIFFLLFIIGLIFPLSVFSLDVPAGLTGDVAEAITKGKILYDAYLKGPVKDYKILAQVNRAKDKIGDFCNFEYKPYAVDSGEGQIIYLIAEPQSQNQIVFGRHYIINRYMSEPQEGFGRSNRVTLSILMIK